MMKQYSLFEFSELIGAVLTEVMPESYWVRAEISSMQVKGGHCYFDLVEKGESGILAARQRAICWANRYAMLSAYFREETGYALQAGMKVLVEVSVNFHAAYGLSLIVEQIDPSFTLGEVVKEREKTIKQLTREGVIDLNKSLPLPSLLKRIAVVSTDTAAGYGDFMNQLEQNGYGFQFTVKLFPALMQGERSAGSVVNALMQIAECETDFDIVVICRGGGATTDLGCFDQYTMAAAVANFPLPVVAGIGHQRDVSVVDIVSHTSVKTPTAAAEYIVAHNAVQWERLRRLAERTQLAATRLTQEMQQLFTDILARLQVLAAQRVQVEKLRLDMAEKTITLRNPSKIFAMGYTLTTCNGVIIKSIEDVQAGDTLVTELAEGHIKSVVK